eukprot:m.363788 g.363788  ORF g.363788 m.363788 type:complete len:316 (-) comp24221_c0_seq1:247-1194(-)
MAATEPKDVSTCTGLGVWQGLLGGLTEDKLRDLETLGYTTVEGAWGEEKVTQFRDEMDLLQDKGYFSPNQVQFTTSQGSMVLTKPGIYECDLHSEEPRAHVPALSELFDSMDTLQSHLQLFELSRGGKSTFTFKLQINDGTSGCFPWHYDNPTRPNKRRVTCLVYLNPEWQDGDGGEVVLLPFLQKPVTIPPRGDTTLLFLSDVILHRVLEASKKRHCFTLWLDSDTTNSDEDMFLRQKHLTEDMIPRLALSPVQRSLSRAVYTEAYIQSNVECFKEGTKEAKLAVLLHNAHLKQLQGNASLARFIDRLRELKEW